MKRAATVIAAAFLLAACGSSGGDDGSATKVYDEADVVAHIGATADGNGSYTVSVEGAECAIPVVLTSAAAVAMYADAGDAVATNADRTAGVKITGDAQATCLEGLSEALSDFG